MSRKSGFSIRRAGERPRVEGELPHDGETLARRHAAEVFVAVRVASRTNAHLLASWLGHGGE
jgi:hypothetical protein